MKKKKNLNNDFSVKLKKLPLSTKIILSSALLILAFAIFYLGFYMGEKSFELINDFEKSMM